MYANDVVRASMNGSDLNQNQRRSFLSVDTLSERGLGLSYLGLSDFIDRVHDEGHFFWE